MLLEDGSSGCRCGRLTSFELTLAEAEAEAYSECDPARRISFEAAQGRVRIDVPGSLGRTRLLRALRRAPPLPTGWSTYRAVRSRTSHSASLSVVLAPDEADAILRPTSALASLPIPSRGRTRMGLLLGVRAAVLPNLRGEEIEHLCGVFPFLSTSGRTAFHELDQRLAHFMLRGTCAEPYGRESGARVPLLETVQNPRRSSRTVIAYRRMACRHPLCMPRSMARRTPPLPSSPIGPGAKRTPHFSIFDDDMEISDADWSDELSRS